MAITEFPTADTFGGPKESARALAASVKRLSSGNFNTLVDRLLALYEAVGLDDGSTTGSLREVTFQINDAIVDLMSDVSDIEDALNALYEVVAGLGVGVQIVSTASATITDARHVIVTYAGGTCTLTLPNAAAAREITIWKGNTSSNTIILNRSADDTASGTINAVTSSFTLTQGYYNDFEGARYDVVGQAAGAWWVSSEWMALSDLRTSMMSFITAISNSLQPLIDAGSGGQVITGTSGTITTALDVYLTNSGATLTITLPDAAANRRIRVHKANSASTQTITFVRSAADISGGGTINGTAASFDITLTSISGTRRAWDVSASAVLEWHVDSGETVAITTLSSSTATNTSNISSNTTDITNLKGGFVPSANVRNLTSGTTATLLVGETLVRQGSANAMALTLPAATAGARITIVKDTTNAGAITLIRAGTDTIHGSASNYVLDGSTYVTSSTTYRAEWRLVVLVAGDWTVEANAVALAAAVATSTAALTAASRAIPLTALSKSGEITLTAQSDPSAASAGDAKLYVKSFAGREVPAFRGANAIPMTLQPFLGRAGIMYSVPGAAAVNTNMGCIQPTHETSSAGAQLTEGSAGSMRSQTRRIYVDGGTSTTSYAGYRGQNLALWRGDATGLGGFFFSTTVALGVAPATHALFVGLIGSTAAFAANVVPSAQVNCIFFGYDSGDATCQIMHNDAAGTCTKIPLTHAKLTTSDLVRVSFWCAPNSTTISYLIEDIAANTSESGTTGTSNLPTNTTFMTWHSHVNVATVSGQAFLEWYGAYGEAGQ